MGISMKSMVCNCGASFRVGSERELIEIVKLHERRSHSMEVDDEKARKAIRNSGIKALS